MFINIVQSFSYLWRINKYQQKIRYEFKSYFFLTTIILKCLGIVQSVSWFFLQLCLTKHFSNEREIGEIPCSRFLSQSKLLRWRQMLRTVFFEKATEVGAAREVQRNLDQDYRQQLNRNHPGIVYVSSLWRRSKLIAKPKFDN